MPEKEIINTKQFVWMLFAIITATASFQLPGMLAAQVGRDAWLSVIGGWGLDVLLAMVYAYLGIRFPGENFVQYSMTILGKYIGRIVGIMFPLFFLVVCTLMLRGLSQLINVAFLPRTPFEVILGSSFFVSAYIAHKGIEVVGRVSEVMSPIYLISGVLLCVMVLPSANIDRLMPQFDQGIKPFLMGAPLALVCYGICIMMAMFIPICNRPENGFLAKFIAVSMGAGFVGIVTSCALGIFGMEEMKNMTFAGLQLARMIKFGHFLERIEIFWILISVGAVIVAAAILLWAFALGTAQVTGLRTYSPLIYPGALVSLVLAITTWNNALEQRDFFQYAFPPYAAFVEAGLELLLFFAAFAFKKRGTN